MSSNCSLCQNLIPWYKAIVLYETATKIGTKLVNKQKQVYFIHIISRGLKRYQIIELLQVILSLQ